MKRKKMPQEIMVYVCDELDDGTPVYGIASQVDEIPEDVSGQRIGVYTLNKSPTFIVKRGLKD